MPGSRAMTDYCEAGSVVRLNMETGRESACTECV